MKKIVKSKYIKKKKKCAWYLKRFDGLAKVGLVPHGPVPVIHFFFQKTKCITLSIYFFLKKKVSRVHVAQPNVFDGQPQGPGHMVNDVFAHHHALRAAKPTKGRIGGQVGQGDAPRHTQVGNAIDIVNVVPVMHFFQQKNKMYNSFNIYFL